MAAGDITYTNPGGESADKPFASGSFESDISEAINIICGFQPSRIELFLVDADATANTYNVWFKGMAASTTAYFADGGDLTFPTTLGPVVYSGSDGEGFTVPAGQTGAADSDVTYWCAWR